MSKNGIFNFYLSCLKNILDPEFLLFLLPLSSSLWLSFSYVDKDNGPNMTEPKDEGVWVCKRWGSPGLLISRILYWKSIHFHLIRNAMFLGVFITGAQFPPKSFWEIQEKERSFPAAVIRGCFIVKGTFRFNIFSWVKERGLQQRNEPKQGMGLGKHRLTGDSTSSHTRLETNSSSPSHHARCRVSNFRSAFSVLSSLKMFNNL